MTAKKTQEELEQPAKQYQLEALSEQMLRVEGLVQTLVADSKNQVSAKYFEERLVAQSTAFEERLKDQDEKQTLRTNDLQKEVTRNSAAFNKFTWAVIVASIGIVASAAGLVWFGK